MWIFIFRRYCHTAAAAAKSLQSCPTLCDPIDGSPPGSAVPGILQARTLEWVAIAFSNAWKWKVKAKSLSRVRLFETPWTAAYQAPPSMGFSRQEYWSGVPLPSPCHTATNIKFAKYDSSFSSASLPLKRVMVLSFYYAFIKYMVIKGKCIVTLICISWLLIILSVHMFMAIIPTFR